MEYGWALSEKSVISIGLDYNLGKGKDVTPTFDGSANTNSALNAQQNYRMSVSSGWLVNQDQLAARIREVGREGTHGWYR